MFAETFKNRNMGHKTIEVEVDLYEFDTDDIVDELVERITRSGRKQLTDKQKQQLLDSIQPLFEELNTLSEAGIKINTIDDEMKRDHIAKVWNKYTPIQFEQLIP